MRRNYENSRPATFIFGESDGSKIKLRWYPKQDYIGIALTNKAYARRNSQWLVAYKISNDGAADLIAGVPLALFERDTPAEEDQTLEETRAPSLDDLIHAAMSKLG